MTELPAYNQLMQDAERFLQGHLPPEALEVSLQAAEDTLDALYIQFFDGLRFQEDHPVLEEVLDPIFQAFARLAAQREPLREALAGGEAERARELLAGGSQAVQEVHRQFARLREALGQREPVSVVPAVDELARVVEAFTRGALPEEPLAERLTQFADYHQRLVAGLASLQPDPAESQVLDPAELAEALERQAEGVQLMQEAFSMQDPELLEEGLAVVLEGTAGLVNLQQRLEGAHQEKTRPCLRCGAANALASRYCTGCQAQLPDMGPPPQSGPGIVTSDLDPGQAGLPENLAILAEAVDQVRDGRLERGEFQKTVDWLLGNVEKSRQQLAGQEEPPEDTPADQIESLEQARSALLAGMDDFEEGLQLLASFLERPDPGRLDHGMELARQGAAAMLELETIVQKVRERRFS